MKKCKICNHEFEANLENFYKNSKNKDGLHSYCKECMKKKSKKWMKDNDERYREKMHERAVRRWERPENKEYQREWSKVQRENGYLKDWQENNKEKLAEYREVREMNKKHEISNDEWNACKEYFNHECAYCGIDEDKSIELYGQQFHKEHVDHDGKNDISNCVPSCKSCNSKKWKYKFEDWYSQSNNIYDEGRLIKILKWLNGDYKNL